jgi:hypothetical protein
MRQLFVSVLALLVALATFSSVSAQQSVQVTIGPGRGRCIRRR